MFTLQTLWKKIKGAYRSLTVWFNVAAGGFVLYLPELQTAFPQVEPYLKSNTFRFWMAGIIVANLFLRFKTNVDLAAKGQPKAPTP